MRWIAGPILSAWVGVVSAEPMKLTPKEIHDLDAAAAGIAGIPDKELSATLLIYALSDVLRERNPACGAKVREQSEVLDRDFVGIMLACGVTCAGPPETLRKLPRAERLQRVIASCDRARVDDVFARFATRRGTFDPMQYAIIRQLLGEVKNALEASPLPKAHEVWPWYDKLLPQVVSALEVDGQMYAGLEAQGVAVDRCVAAMNAARAAPSNAGAIARACADLYREPGCRDAHLHFDDAPVAERASALAKACAAAYCPKIPAPQQPALCKAPPSKPSELARDWHAFRVMILEHDLTEANRRRFTAAQR
jgi:hypothetical protein